MLSTTPKQAAASGSFDVTPSYSLSFQPRSGIRESGIQRAQMHMTSQQAKKSEGEAISDTRRNLKQMVGYRPKTAPANYIIAPTMVTNRPSGPARHGFGLERRNKNSRDEARLNHANLHPNSINNKNHQNMPIPKAWRTQSH